MKKYQKLYLSSFISTIFFFSFILLICYYFPIGIVLSILLFFYYFYKRERKYVWEQLFGKKGKELIALFLISFFPCYADFYTMVTLLGDKKYEIRQEAFSTLLEYGQQDPYGMVVFLKNWQEHPDPEIRHQVNYLIQILEKTCYYNQQTPPLYQQILEEIGKEHLESAYGLCEQYKEVNAPDYGEKVSFLHREISTIIRLKAMAGADLETEYYNKGQIGLKYHSLYLYFLEKQQPLPSLAQKALAYYEERIRPGRLSTRDNDLKKIALFRYCLNYSLGNQALAEKDFEDYQALSGKDLPVDLAFYYQTRGQPDKALEYLSRAIDEGGYELWKEVVFFSTFFSPLRTHPRFKRLSQRKGTRR